MSEFTDWIPLFSLLLAGILGIFTIFTYRRVSKKYYSRTVSFNDYIEPNGILTLLDVEGSGLLQKIELEAWENLLGLIIIESDNTTIFRKTLQELNAQQSSYVRFFGSGHCSLEMPLDKNFYKKIKIQFKNQNEKDKLEVKGNIAINIDRIKGN